MYEKKYKTSKYNYFLKHNEIDYVFNGVSGGFGVIDLQTKKHLLESIESLPCDSLEKLRHGWVIIPNQLNELGYIKARHFQNRFSNTNSLGLTIAPTLNCNFRCTYCYENTCSQDLSVISKDVMDKVIEFVDKRLSKNGKLSVTWFGGEPLLALALAFRDCRFL